MDADLYSGREVVVVSGGELVIVAVRNNIYMYIYISTGKAQYMRTKVYLQGHIVPLEVIILAGRIL
jgi:hypothetical protein